MTPQECYQAGNLQEAITQATAAVRQRSTDTAARGFLCELLCFAGEWERADKQLDALAQQDPESLMGAALFRQLLRGAVARQQLFSEGRVPELLDQPSEVVRLSLEASILFRQGKPAEAVPLLAQVEQKRSRPKGTCDGKAFDDFRDCDDLMAAVLEVLTTTGKYYWIPFDRIEVIEFRPPARPRDLVWRRAHVVVREGPDGEVYLPAIYSGTTSSSDEQLKLGRSTEWQGSAGMPTRGLGQRTFLVGDEGRSILEVQTVTFETA